MTTDAEKMEARRRVAQKRRERLAQQEARRDRIGARNLAPDAERAEQQRILRGRGTTSAAVNPAVAREAEARRKRAAEVRARAHRIASQRDAPRVPLGVAVPPPMAAAIPPPAPVPTPAPPLAAALPLPTAQALPMGVPLPVAAAVPALPPMARPLDAPPAYEFDDRAAQGRAAFMQALQ